MIMKAEAIPQSSTCHCEAGMTVEAEAIPLINGIASLRPDIYRDYVRNDR